MLMKYRGILVSTKKRTNKTMAIAFVEKALLISKNSWFQPGLLSRSLKFEFPCNGHIFYSKPIIQIIQWFSVFKFLMDKIILKAERKNFDA